MEKKPVIAIMATYQPRFVKIVWDAILSLTPQVDAIRLNINYPYTQEEKQFMIECAGGVTEQTGVPVIPRFLNTDMGDLAKFHPLVKEDIHEDAIVLTVDDDIIYPCGYVDYLRELLDQYDYVSFGGKILNDPPYTTWRASWAQRISLWNGLDRKYAIPIHVPLTGASAFVRSTLGKVFYDTRYRNNGDLLMAYWLRKAHVKPVCVPFVPGYFKYHPLMAHKPTIWDFAKSNDEWQKATALLAEEVINARKPVTS